jgi:hypothetical protein
VKLAGHVGFRPETTPLPTVPHPKPSSLALLSCPGIKWRVFGGIHCAAPQRPELARSRTSSPPISSMRHGPGGKCLPSYVDRRCIARSSSCHYLLSFRATDRRAGARPARLGGADSRRHAPPGASSNGNGQVSTGSSNICGAINGSSKPGVPGHHNSRLRIWRIRIERSRPSRGSIERATSETTGRFARGNLWLIRRVSRATAEVFPDITPARNDPPFHVKSRLPVLAGAQDYVNSP